MCIYVFMGKEMDIYMLITIWFGHQYRNSEFKKKKKFRILE